MTIMAQSKIKGGYIYYSIDLSLPPIGDISSSTQIYLDWTLSPFVDITTAGAGQECTDGSEPIFFRQWGGLEEGCYFENWFRNDEVIALSDLENKKECNRRTMTFAHTPVMQSFLGDVTICGKRGGDPFRSV